MSTLRRALGLRLSMWYAAVFTISTIGLVALTYALIAQSLAQRDHDIIRATWREYASRYELGGLGALSRAVELEERTSGQERLFVRVLGPYGGNAVFVRDPQGWGAYDVEELGGGADGLGDDLGHDRRAVLEIASARLPDGTILQVGKTNEIRLALLRRFEVIVGIVLFVALAIGISGGLVLTQSTVKPIYQLIDVVQDIIRTGRTGTRVPVREARGHSCVLPHCAWRKAVAGICPRALRIRQGNHSFYTGDIRAAGSVGAGSPCTQASR